MKKTNEEFKAEVFRRRDEYYKKRNRRIRIAAIASAPLACLTAFMIMILPAMMPASAEDPNFDPHNVESGETEQIRVNVESVAYSLVSAEMLIDMPSFMEEEKVQDFAVLFSFLTWKEDTENTDKPSVNLTEATTTSAQISAKSYPYYSITLHYEFGEPRTYFLYEDRIVCGSDEFPITMGQFMILTEFLG